MAEQPESIDVSDIPEILQLAEDDHDAWACLAGHSLPHGSRAHPTGASDSSRHQPLTHLPDRERSLHAIRDDVAKTGHDTRPGSSHYLYQADGDPRSQLTEQRRFVLVRPVTASPLNAPRACTCVSVPRSDVRPMCRDGRPRVRRVRFYEQSLSKRDEPQTCQPLPCERTSVRRHRVRATL